MPIDQEYAIGELADLAGVTPRTIRYYVSIGLLPAPEQAGPRTRYTEGHLKRLQLIRRLQRQHLPLAEIGLHMAQLDDEAVEEALDAEVAPKPTDSALDYIKSLQGGRPSQPPDPLLHQDVSVQPMRIAEAKPPSYKAPSYKPAQITRTRWERVRLGESVELHIRVPQDKRKHEQIDRLIRLGRELLAEGE